MTSECTANDCSSPILAKGLCRKHYQRLYKTGTLESSFVNVKPFDRFGRLIAVRRIPSPRNKWLCKCVCGNEVIVFASNLTRRHSTSCGCASLEAVTTHGKSRTPEYRAWINIRTRCTDQTTPYWPLYGGRGIKVCDRWQSFDAFLADMGPRPEGHSIDRENVNGDYEPSNCRWADKKTQGRNKRVQRMVVVNGRSMTLAEAVEGKGLLYNTVLYRLRRGWTIDEALDG